MKSIAVESEVVPGPYTEPSLRSSKIAIVGFASESMGDAPWDDQDYEIWILNMLHAHVPRWDRLWEMHDRATVEEETAELKRDTDHLGILQRERERPIYQIEPWVDVPNAVKFPLQEVVTFVGTRCQKLIETPYFTSTFAFMIAYATMRIVQRRKYANEPEDDEAICVAGVEMLNGEEYAYQRSNAEFMIGLAIGYGIPVHIPTRSALLESDGMYGYANGESLQMLSRMRAYYKDKRQSFIDQSLLARSRRDQFRADYNTNDGAMQIVESLLALPDLDGKVISALKQRQKTAETARAEAARQRDEAQMAYGIFEGCAQGVDWTINHITYLARGGKV